MRGKVLMLALFSCFALVQAGAQAAPPTHNILTDPNAFAQAHVNGLDAQVHLSEQQKAKLRPLFVAEGQKLISILSNPSLREDQRQQMIQQLHLETQAAAMSMLTPSQLKQFNSAPQMAAPRQSPSSQRI